MNPALTLLVYALAVARGSVLVTEDRLTKKPREWALHKLNDRHWRAFRKLSAVGRGHIEAGRLIPRDIAAQLDAEAKLATDRKGTGYLEYLLTCQWCVSIWLGGIAAFVWWNWPTEPWSLGPAVVLAFSMVTGKLAQWGS